jgi:hypothetical protein
VQFLSQKQASHHPYALNSNTILRFLILLSCRLGSANFSSLDYGPVKEHEDCYRCNVRLLCYIVRYVFDLPKMTLASAVNNQVRISKVQGYLLTKPLKNWLNYPQFHISNVSFCSEITEVLLTVVWKLLSSMAPSKFL